MAMMLHYDCPFYMIRRGMVSGRSSHCTVRKIAGGFGIRQGRSLRAIAACASKPTIQATNAHLSTSARPGTTCAQHGTIQPSPAPLNEAKPQLLVLSSWPRSTNEDLHGGSSAFEALNPGHETFIGRDEQVVGGLVGC